MAQRTGTPIDPGIIARVVAGVRYAVSGVKPQDWFGPGQPLDPVAQQVQGRNLDYPVTTNLQIIPRANEPINFAQLRGLADGCDIVRLAIETRKDQMAKLKWAIQPKDKDTKPDSRCDDLTNFFAYPDKERDWSTWLRVILEDLMVIDAPAIYVRLTNGKKPYGFENIDGATIKRLINSDGRTPIAPDPAYQQILHGLPAVDYTSDELIYKPRNQRSHKLYGFSPVEQIIITINTLIRKALFQQEYYTAGSIPDAIIGVPSTWNPDQIKMFQEYWDAQLSGNSSERRKAKFVADGVNFHPTKTEPLKDEFDDWLARIVCYAFSLPPTAFVKQQNRATAQTAQDAAIEEGLAPMMLWVKSVIDSIIVKYFGYSDLEFIWPNEKESDPLVQAQINQIYVTTGVKTINEVRTELGLEAIDEPVDDQSIVTDDEPPGTPAASEKLLKVGKKKVLKPINRQRPAVKKSVKAMRTSLTDVFASAKNTMIPAITAAYEKINKAANSDDVDGVLDGLDTDDFLAVVSVAQNHLATTAKDGGKLALKQIAVSDSEISETIAKKATDIANVRAAELVGKKWVNGKLVDNPDANWAITDSTRELLRTDLQDAIDEGWSTDELADKLQENYAFSEERADVIARTEIAMIDQKGSMIAYRESGVVEGKEWLLAEEPCDECQANADEGVIPLDQDFSSGDDAAPAHPRCECTTSPVVYELETENEEE